MQVARELASRLAPGDRVLLEGEMGAGKSTFARAAMAALGVSRSAEGSPSFAIAHEYASARGEIAHIDLYRMKSEAEIESAGVLSYVWERSMIVFVEWASRFPGFFRSLSESGGGKVFKVGIALSGEGSDRRDLLIEEL